MDIKQISAIEAVSFFESNSDVLYIDVRTVAEFALGHPKIRCVNIPVIFQYPNCDRVLDNDAFPLVVSHTLSEADIIIVGSARNARAQRAAKIMVNSGLSKIQSLADGYIGWIEAGMPSTKDNRDGVSYASLLTKARRAKK